MKKKNICFALLYVMIIFIISGFAKPDSEMDGKVTGHLLLTDKEGNILFDNLDGDFIESAKVVETENGDGVFTYVVIVKFKTEYVEKLAEITQENLGKHLAVILDDEICANPLIQEKIANGEFLMGPLVTKQDAEMVEKIWNSKYCSGGG